MQGITEVLKGLERMAREAKNNPGTSSNTDLSKQCPICNDTEFIIDGWAAKPCPCSEQKRLLSRIKNALIPDQFVNAEFDTYIVKSPTQRIMFDAVQTYLGRFDEIKKNTVNSLGFIAAFGEQKIREIKSHTQRSETKRLHNNFGLGKTHLQVAAAKELINRGYSTLIVSDVVFMEDLSKARMYGDDGEAINKLIGAAIKADVLLWDDIGKAKPSDFRMGMYYQIIDERYRSRKPIIYSSNEDMETLTERIGDASASRLFGMSKEYLLAVEDRDYRLMRA